MPGAEGESDDDEEEEKEEDMAEARVSKAASPVLPTPLADPPV